ncbi:hypothetical protein TD95_000647 [Thielaviopsis punctulata]|uniref:Chromatin assembly factor 1 subunit A n=1 Tax=Thielaviopsis punctulata TaxID=72032 RepID=A0A0F4ZJR4_9PEZI|nr:hypothetical protein TD95_000647 [Thielaviopsis punctulata]
MDVDPRTSPNLPDSSGDDLSSIASDDVAMMDAPLMSSQAATSNRRKRPTAEEKAAKAEEEAAKKREREEARLQKLAEKAKLDAEKAIKAAAKAKADAERQIARAKADAERAVKQAEREEKKRKKEEEERRIQEEKERKERSQMRLNSFFKKPLTTKASTSGSATTGAQAADKTVRDGAGKAEAVNDYKKTFKPFFIKESVRMAPLPADSLDAARLADISAKFDNYVRGASAPSDPMEAVRSLCAKGHGRRRGMVHEPVKRLIEDMRERAFDDAGVQRARAALARVPVKTLFFSTDVRPAYCGTVTGVQSRAGVATVLRAGRRPLHRVFAELAYDYDSEAEWVDDEMGEDVDLDDEEEEVDDEDDMDGFLDDSEDAGVARGAFSSSMEPESTGVCFETKTGETATTELYAYRMEFIMPSIAPTGSIDPFSTEYWDPEPKRSKPPTAGSMAPPPHPAPSNAFEALHGSKTADSNPGTGANTASAAAQTGTATLELRRPELLPEIKRVIVDNNKLSKLGLIDVLFHQVEGLTKGEAKMALDMLAIKVGTGRVKQWALRESME